MERRLFLTGAASLPLASVASDTSIPLDGDVEKLYTEDEVIDLCVKAERRVVKRLKPDLTPQEEMIDLRDRMVELIKQTCPIEGRILMSTDHGYIKDGTFFASVVSDDDLRHEVWYPFKNANWRQA